MRTTLFLPALCAVTLLGGAALAHPSHGSADHLRARGDVVDKSYRVAERSPAARISHDVGVPVQPTFEHASMRVACSEMAPDCPQRGSTRGLEAAAGQPGHAARAPAFLDKVLGSDRSNFNEAGESQGMSSHAVQRAWSHAGTGASSAASLPLSHQQQRLRTEGQASQNRMSCNEGGECTMSSKGAKKEWAYQSVKAGTWRAPEVKQAVAAPAPAASPATSSAVVVTTSRRAAKTEAPKPD